MSPDEARGGPADPSRKEIHEPTRNTSLFRARFV